MNAPERRARFKQVDVARALRGALDAGMRPTCAKIEDDGSIVVMFTDAPAILRRNPLDRIFDQ